MREVPVAVAVACTAGPSSGQSTLGPAQTAYADSVAPTGSSAPSVLLLDPSVAEVSAVGGQSGCVLQLGFGCCSDRVVFVLSSGRLPVADLSAMLTASQAACHAIHQRMKDEMIRCSQASGSRQLTLVSVPLAVR